MTFSRKALIAVSASLAVALTMSSAFAGGASSSLGECYNTTISNCNQNSAHPIACAESAMDACDALHKQKSNATPRPATLNFGARLFQTGLLLPAVQSAREAARRAG